MLLLQHNRDPRRFFVIGGAFLLFGILGSLAAMTAETRIAEPFLRGFLFGLSGAMIGASMVFNLVGLRLRGKERSEA